MKNLVILISSLFILLGCHNLTHLVEGERYTGYKWGERHKTYSKEEQSDLQNDRINKEKIYKKCVEKQKECENEWLKYDDCLWMSNYGRNYVCENKPSCERNFPLDFRCNKNSSINFFRLLN